MVNRIYLVFEVLRERMRNEKGKGPKAESLDLWHLVFLRRRGQHRRLRKNSQKERKAKEFFYKEGVVNTDKYN